MKFFLYLIAAFALAQSALAKGVDSSGGGFAVVCRDAAKNISSARLLDLFEAEQRYGLVLRPGQNSLDLDYVEYYKKLGEVWDNYLGTPNLPPDQEQISLILREFHETLKTRFIFLPPGVPVAGPPDWGTTVPLPTGCKLEQAARYHDDDENIRVNSNIWNAFDSQSQAALLAHEFIYAPYRNMGDVTSESARRVVGRFFAAAPMPDVKEGMPAGALSCGTSIEPVNGVKPKGASTFAVYPDPKNPDGMILQFPMLFGRLTFAPLKVRLPVAYDSKQFTTHDSAFLVVKDPRANIDGNFQIEDGIFKDSFIRVRYVAGKIMEVGMTDPQGKPLFMARVLNQCGSGL